MPFGVGQVKDELIVEFNRAGKITGRPMGDPVLLAMKKATGDEMSQIRFLN